jgi:hypothetical protein
VSRWFRSSALAGLLALSGAWAADDAVQITAIRQPVDKSYRKMVQGMDLYEEMHALAPKAQLRYRLYPRKRDADLHVGALYLIGSNTERAVPVGPDNTFTLARDRKALAEDAFLRSERRAGSMTWRADIRTPGLPADTRRLGDLRLECLVGVQAGLVSQYPGVIGQFFKLLETPRGFCERTEVPYLFFAERALFSVTLHAGERRQAVSIGNLYAGVAHGRTPAEERKYCDCEALLDRAYTLPLGDRSWPDETLVEMHYMEDAADASDAYAMFIGSTKGDMRAAFGEAARVPFDNGYEVWSYEFGPELIVLFSPSGVVSNIRLRPPPAP